MISGLKKNKTKQKPIQIILKLLKTEGSETSLKVGRERSHVIYGDQRQELKNYSHTKLYKPEDTEVTSAKFSKTNQSSILSENIF